MSETFTCRYCGEPIEIIELTELSMPGMYVYKHDTLGCLLYSAPMYEHASVWSHDELVAALNMQRMTCDNCDNQEICRHIVSFKASVEYRVDTCSRWEPIP